MDRSDWGAHLHPGQPEREPVNIHVVLDRVKKLALSGFARNIKFAESYDPSLPFVLAWVLAFVTYQCGKILGLG